MADPLILFMPSGKRGRFPEGTTVLEAARQLGGEISSWSIEGGKLTANVPEWADTAVQIIALDLA